jgi:hypothetical protein
MLPQAMSGERCGREEVPLPQGTTSGAGGKVNLLLVLSEAKRLASGSREGLLCAEICHLSPAPISSEKPGCLAPPRSAARKDPTTGVVRRV